MMVDLNEVMLVFYVDVCFVDVVFVLVWVEVIKVNDINCMEILVYGSDIVGIFILIVMFDNLGKGVLGIVV